LLAILSEIFIQIGYFFLELYKKTKVNVFFSEHSVESESGENRNNKVACA